MKIDTNLEIAILLWTRVIFSRNQQQAEVFFTFPVMESINGIQARDVQCDLPLGNECMCVVTPLAGIIPDQGEKEG